MSALEIYVEDEARHPDLRLVEPLPEVTGGAAAKRLFDIVFAIAVMVAGLPLFLALVGLVAATSRGPVFYGHTRVGRGGRQFRCLKLRTMQPDADARLEHLLREDPAARAEFELTYKLKDDPRITPVGRVLRRTSLDELPQFWNVLRGDMAIVGPRPVVPDELARYGRHASAYLALRPGLTGPWQVSGRNDVSYEERVSLDASYAQDPCMRRDVEILFRTLSVVARRAGAY